MRVQLNSASQTVRPNTILQNRFSTTKLGFGKFPEIHRNSQQRNQSFLILFPTLSCTIKVPVPQPDTETIAISAVSRHNCEMNADVKKLKLVVQ